jgi:hypothetical protein
LFSKVEMVSIYITKPQTPSHVISDFSMFQRYTQQFLSSVRPLGGPKGDRGILGLHGLRGRVGKRGFTGKKGEKGADGRCEICCRDLKNEFPLEDADYDQEEERKTLQGLRETKSSLEVANKDSVEQDMKSKIRLF